MARPKSQTILKSHGSPFGVDHVKAHEATCGQEFLWLAEPPLRSRQARQHFRKAIERGKSAETESDDRLSAYGRAFPDLARAFQQAMHGELPDGWDRDIAAFPADEKGMATRVAAGKVMNAVAPRLPALIGGSADLNPRPIARFRGGRLRARPSDAPDKQGAADGVWSYAAAILFGVREHGWGDPEWSGGARRSCHGATFLIFSTTCGRRFASRRL